MAEMRGYEGSVKSFVLILFHIVIYSIERVEFFVSCFADIKNVLQILMLIEGKLAINNYTYV